MKQDKWTQQLRDKLADHEVAPPEDLWADIEAALPQPLQPSQPRKARFAPLRRWAVAASVALLLGGTYLLWNRYDAPQMASESYLHEPPYLSENEEPSTPTAQTAHVSAADASPVSKRVAIVRTPLQPPVTETVAMVSGSSAVTTSDARAEGADVVAEPSEPLALPDPDLLAVASEPAMSPVPDRAAVSEPVVSSALDRSAASGANERYATSERMLRKSNQTANYRTPHDADFQTMDGSVRRTDKSLGVGLFAMNGLGVQTNSNGVQMANSMAESYSKYFLSDNAAAAKPDGIIYLSGYEEHQHHHRPVSYGLTLSYPLTERFSLTTGVVYTKLFSEFTQFMRRQRTDQEQTLHYVGIPVGVSYSLWHYQSLKTYLSAGVKADFNVATHLETEGVTQHLDRDRLQWSFCGSLGLEYELLPQVALYAEPALSAFPDNGSPLQNYFKDKPLNGSLQVGLRVNFRR